MLQSGSSSEWPQLLEIQDTQWTALLEGLARAEYHLLLGAGASANAVDRSGRPLPTGKDLAQQLINDFHIDSQGVDLSLSRAYELAKRRRVTPEGASLTTYFSNRFTGCQPPEWYRTVCATRWEQIWTFNVDDVVEQAYSMYRAMDPSGVAQEPVSMVWTDKFRHADAAKDQVFVLHLHGSTNAAGQGDIPSNFVFDILEYLRAGRREGTWPRAFEDEYETRPFIVVGARLLEEYDLADVLRRGNRSYEMLGRPSFLVSPHIRGFDPKELTEWGLIPVNADAESFFWAISQDLPPVQRAYDKRTYRVEGPVPHQAKAFLQQFRELSLSSETSLQGGYRKRERGTRDFYAGDDPSWDDIVAGLDAPLGVTDHLIDTIHKHAAVTTKQAVYCITGGPGLFRRTCGVGVA